jgi:hypothetical protein
VDRVRKTAFILVTAAIVLFIGEALIAGWPFDHVFQTYTWPGPFGWIAHNCPGNVVAGFIQVSLGFLAGYGAHKLGAFEHLKFWATKEIRLDRAAAVEHEKWVAQTLATLHKHATGASPADHPHHGKLT